MCASSGNQSLLTDPLFLSIECNRAELVDVQLLADIACDNKILPQLKTLSLNLGDMLSTSDRLTPEQLEYFEQLFNLIKTRGVRSTRTNQGFSLFFNNVHMNPVVSPTVSITGQIVQPVMQFSDLHFDQPLVVCLYLNYTKNRLSIFFRPVSRTAEYLDVLRTFYHLEPSLSGNASIYGFRKFALLFPQIQSVTLHNENREAMPDASLFLRFLWELRGLQRLVVHSAGFSDAEFYSRLIQTASLRTLHTLELYERRGEFKEHIFFGFLASFVYLRRFVTNLVIARWIPCFPQMMKLESHFIFGFWHESFGDEFAEVNIKRNSLLKYEIFVAERNSSDPNFERRYYEKYFDESICKVYIDPEKLPIHWLDSV